MVNHGPTSAYDDEFPLLKANGLYASDISGDGDCLFHALSDQLYGHENSHREIRAAVVQHMRLHSDYFKLFLSVPATKTKKKSRNSIDEYQPPTESAIEVAFQQHIKRMSQQGVYGDNLEICAFAREYDCDVKIYQRDFAYVVSGGDDSAAERKMVHIAYHTWEHYSSIRNVAGPYTGPPEVNPVLDPTAAAAAAAEERKKGGKKGGGKYALPWMVDIVMRSLPYLATEEEVAKALEECKGDVNEAVGRMLDKEAGVDSGQSGDEAGEEESVGDSKTNKDGDVLGEQTGKKPPTPPSSPKPKETKQKGSKNPHASQKRGKAVTTTDSSTATTTTPNKSKNTNASTKSKPKRESARERKERQKAEAAERKRNKGPGGASKTDTSKVANSSSKETSTVEGGIRELYI